MIRNGRTILAAALAGLMLLACGGGVPKASGTAADQGAQPERQPADDGARVQGLLGNIPNHEAQAVFERGLNKLGECYGLALDVSDAIAGSLEFAVVVGGDGGVTSVFLRSTDLGSVEAEECLVDAVSRLRFPRPRGGDRAELTWSMAVEPPGGRVAVVAWDASRIAAAIEEHREEVDRCLAGATGVRLTLYVGAGGRVISAGGSSDTAQAAAGVRCLARAAAAWTLPDPGQDLAKAVVSF
jgi:hypothetical protein